ncbi:MAG: aspartyl/glutamyl-tRNA amidotransferase subunit C [Thermoplasmata archaeon YP2-bin.285]|uniref:Aspartyl/glutamyl-tRNA amidotransferase subunit C n=1 Tax=Candidatus Sysuiplasma superficiale TaxID=2823368 RepID=A0A8J7YPC3_9ARCH|nr:aspartyl/glutamyl-tRNA amidotransferase subunit C [Candidatus Sysuiplasma superficiale]
MRRIERDDLARISGLCRLSLSEEETDVFLNEINSILDFFSEIRSMASDSGTVSEGAIRPREDGNCSNTQDEQEIILNDFPAREGKFLLVPRGL